MLRRRKILSKVYKDKHYVQYSIAKNDRYHEYLSFFGAGKGT